MIRNRAAREKAIALLSMYGLTTPPIDVKAIAEELGFDIVLFPFPDTMSAVLRINDSKKVIAVNHSQSEVRQRFSVAHELGHYLSGHEDYSHDRVVAVEYENKYNNPMYLMEQEADEFAAELLMPSFLLRKELVKDRSDAKDLAKKYSVSEQAMWIQLINLMQTDENRLSF